VLLRALQLQIKLLLAFSQASQSLFRFGNDLPGQLPCLPAGLLLLSLISLLFCLQLGQRFIGRLHRTCGFLPIAMIRCQTLGRLAGRQLLHLWFRRRPSLLCLLLLLFCRLQRQLGLAAVLQPLPLRKQGLLLPGQR
jgi:hypothetical protein